MRGTKSIQTMYGVRKSGTPDSSSLSVKVGHLGRPFLVRYLGFD